MIKYLFFIIGVVFCFFPGMALAQSISNINIGPSLDISRFAPYTISAEISDYSTSSPVGIGISTINGDGGAYWNYYANGNPYSDNLNFQMSYISGNRWEKIIYPDYVYPEIFFAPSSITWANAPLSTTIRRNDYHLFHLENPFTMVNNMNFWIEVNAVPRAANSADLQVYLVSKGKESTFFNSDWINGVGSSSVELVGTISRTATFSHTHSVNSSHHLVTVTANADGTVGDKHLDISGDFWIVLYNTSPNVSRGWDLRYQGTNLCTNSNRWYRGNISGWSLSAQNGCPDSHVHLLRRTAEVTDRVLAVVSAGSTLASQTFGYTPLPNLAPNATRFLNPVGGAYAGEMEINWEPASDPNNDALTYYLYLLNSEGVVVRTLSAGTTATNLSWGTSAVSNGSYGIGATVCDPASACAQFQTDTNFLINNASPIYNLSSISIGPTKVVSGEVVNLDFVSSGSLPTVTVNFYANGVITQNTATVSNVGANNWRASLVVGENDANGELSFVISSASLGSEYYQSTDGSWVNIDNPLPTATPIPTETPSPTATVVPTATPTPRATSRRITDLSSDTMREELTNNYLSINGISPENTSDFTFEVDYTFVNGGVEVFLPAGTMGSRNGGGSLNLNNFLVGDNSSEIRSSLTNSLRALRLGIPEMGLSFSKKIQIKMVVGEEYNGQNLEVDFRREGESEWQREGTCVISGGNCVFETDHATTFVVKKNSASSGGVNNSTISSSGGAICGDAKPVLVPDLFQIDAASKNAKLFFTPVNNAKQYYISFSTKPEAEEHGELVTLLSEGVQSHKVFFLKPRTTYYFKVRAQNGCMPGEWSSVMKIKTDSRKYYKYVIEKKGIKKTATKKEDVNEIKNIVSELPKKEEEKPIVEVKKESFWEKIKKFFSF